MPGFDGTGPAGAGPLTGGGRGYCVAPADSLRRPFGGRFFGRGGRGRGWRHRYRATGLPGWARFGYGDPSYGAELTGKEEISALKDEASFLKRQLESVQNQISTLEKAEQ